MDKEPECLRWPHKIDVDNLVTDDHWVTNDPSYRKLAIREDNSDAVSILLPWGEGYYVGFGNRYT